MDTASPSGSDRETVPRIPGDVWAVSFTSLFSEWSYEMILGVVPFFLSFVRGATPFLIGSISGAADFAQSGVQTVAGARWAVGPGRKVRGAGGISPRP
ncbi:MAG: hypothetical protein ACREEC_03690 [Thermoplasmata archaeon]